MLIGFARLSQHEKPADLDRQLRELTAAGCTKTFVSRSLPKAADPVRTECLKFVREGDILVVSRPDRITWLPSLLIKLIDTLGKRGVAMIILSIGGVRLDTRDAATGAASGAASAAVLASLRALARWRGDYLREMGSASMVAAQAAGKFKGRSPTICKTEVIELARNGMRPGKIATHLGCSRSTIWRCLGVGYRVQPIVKPTPRPRIDAATVAILSRSLRPGEVAKAMGISRASVRNLRGW